MPACRVLATSLAVLVVLLSVATPTAAQSEPPPRYDPVWHTSIAAGSFIGAGLVDWLERHADHTCRWCGVDAHGAPDVPGIDRWAHTHWNWTNEGRAATISNVTASAAYVWPLAALSIVHGGIDTSWGRDLTVTLSSLGVAQLGTAVAKRVSRRSRPTVVFDGDAIGDADDVHSFFSAHAATTFAAVMSVGSIASRRGSSHATLIWITGVTLAGSTAYLRVAADRHFLTDALAGAAAGAAVGFVMPRVFDTGDSSGMPARAPLVSSSIVGVGPLARVTQRRAAVTLQLGAGAGTIGIVGTVGLR